MRLLFVIFYYEFLPNLTPRLTIDRKYYIDLNVFHTSAQRKCMGSTIIGSFLKEKNMDIGIVQNVVLIGFSIVTFLMYITAKAWDEIADEMEVEEKSR